jgi:hypothetical protein
MNPKIWGLGQIDYDNEWLSSLSSLHFEMRLSRESGNLAEGSYRVDGIAGVGAHSLVFKATSPDGSLVAIKTQVPRLAFFIRELPASMAVFPSRDIQAIWRKVMKLVGDPVVDFLVDEYDQLYSNIFFSLHESSVAQLDQVKWSSDRSQFLMGFALRTPGMMYRLEDWASGGSSEPKDVEWASNALKSVSRIAKTEPDFRPEELLDNPFYICAGAILDGVFLSDEFPILIDRLRDTYGLRDEGSQVDVWLTQCWVIGNLLGDLVTTSSVESFVAFYNLCDRALSVSGQE